MSESKKLNVRSGDNVVVISGKEKGKKGKILEALPREGKVVVAGVNVVTRHKKSQGAGKPGGKMKQEAPIFASKVMIVCGKCNKATRVGHKFLEDGSKVRVCKKCGETL